VSQLTPYSEPNAGQLIDAMGTWIAKSGLLGCQNVDQGKVIAMTCICKGVDPLTLAQTYHIVQGQLTMRTDAMLAEFHRLGGRHKILERTSDCASVQLSYQGIENTFSLTWEEAKAEPFTKGKGGAIKTNYATPRIRKQMLWARCVSDAVRAVCPEVCAGVYAPEELTIMQARNVSAHANGFTQPYHERKSSATWLDRSTLPMRCAVEM
jgi:hypothetical protein